MTRTERPFFGHRGNWSLISSRIQCWADAVDCLVYHINDEAVLALDGDEAAKIAVGEGSMGELKEVQSEIRALECKIWDLEDELAKLEQQEKKLLDAIKLNKLLGVQKEPEWVRNHPTFAFCQKEVAP
jgi:hypothetical protein